MEGLELATGRWPGKGVPDIDEERVLQAPEDADFAQHPLGLLWAAQYIWDPFKGHLQTLLTSGLTLDLSTRCTERKQAPLVNKWSWRAGGYPDMLVEVGRASICEYLLLSEGI